ncbi:hypothetical protein, partial [Vibrio splendidus]|uniref:hypothetical protein n=1 Tax=Vibrio splendidus TaxID=29497 RepID=UPI001A7E0448
CAFSIRNLGLRMNLLKLALIKLGLDTGIKDQALLVSTLMINEFTLLCSRASIRALTKATLPIR